MDCEQRVDLDAEGLAAEGVEFDDEEVGGLGREERLQARATLLEDGARIRARSGEQRLEFGIHAQRGQAHFGHVGRQRGLHRRPAAHED